MDYKGIYSKSLYVGTKKGDYIGSVSAINENSEANHFQFQQMLGYNKTFSDKNISAKIEIPESAQLNYIYEFDNKPNRGEIAQEFFNSSSPNYVGNLKNV